MPGNERPFDNADAPGNNSGTDDPAPPEVLALGYCWPGVLFPMWFRLANQIPWAFSLDMPFALGPHGYEWAWQSRHWRGVNEFCALMARWKWAARATAALAACAVISGLVHSLRR